jgi:hypothetical protein
MQGTLLISLVAMCNAVRNAKFALLLNASRNGFNPAEVTP